MPSTGRHRLSHTRRTATHKDHIPSICSCVCEVCISHTRDCLHHIISRLTSLFIVFLALPRPPCFLLASSVLPPCSPSQDFGGTSGDAAKAAGAGGGENKDDDAAGALAEASAAAAAADAEKVCIRIRRVRACSRMYVICVFSCGKHIVGGCAHENTSEVGSRDVRRTGIGWVVHNTVNVVLGTHPAE